MKKIAILLENQYQTLEVWYPYYRLKELNYEVALVGTGKGDYKSKVGYPAKEDISIDNVNTDEFSGVIIPGGYAPDFLRRYKKINEFVKELFEQNKLVAYICHGGWVAVSADILKGKSATCFFAIKDDVLNAGAKYYDEEVVVDNNLITSRKPDDLPSFMREIISFLENN